MYKIYNIRWFVLPARTWSIGILFVLFPAMAWAQSREACELPRSEPSALNVDVGALDSLVALARDAQSDALVVLRDGRVAGEWYFGRPPGPIQTMSVTKSIVGLLIGRLLDAGSVESLDQPVADFYPEWRQGRKGDITIGMLLRHTSGLQNVANAGAEIYPAPDAVQLALAAELDADPGTEFSYNNKAVNLLAGIVEKATGRPLDEAVHREILAPLCIERTDWYEDASGTPHVMAGLELTPLALARIGQLVLQEGRWGERQVVPPEWVRLSTSPSQDFYPRAGLLWFLLPQPGDSITASTARDELRGFYSEGYLGNYVVILPAQRIVVVRMKRTSEDFEPPDAMPGFPRLVAELLTGDA